MKPIRLTVSLSVCAALCWALLGGCNSHREENPSSRATASDPRPIVGAPAAHTSIGTAAVDKSPRAAAAATVAPAAALSNRTFTLALYAQLREHSKDNLVIAPASVQLALALVLWGARGTTAASMTEVLFSGDAPRAKAELPTLMRALSSFDSSGSPFAQCVFVGHSEPATAYRQRIAQDFAADLQPLFPGGAARVDAWVKEKTHGAITTLVPDPPLPPDTQLYLASAFYWQQAWQTAFDPAQTSVLPFTLPSGRPVSVPTMQATLTAGYARDALRSGAELELLELPYAGERASLIIAVPEQGTSLLELERELDEQRLSRWFAALSPAAIRVALPRFELHHAPSLLASTLTDMGMGSAFTFSRDFSDIVGTESKLALGDLAHSTMIRVDEHGTQAAAASGTPVIVKSTPHTVAVNRPFLFMLRDRATNALYLIGRLTDPTRS